MKKFFVFFVSLYFSLFCLYAQELQPSVDKAIISPCAGVFANKQALVLDLQSTQEAFYSFSSSDPITSGFAYDGPVLIDLDGKVEVYIAIVDKDGIKKDFSICYEVSPCNISEITKDTKNKNVQDFLNFLDKNPLLRYDNGKDFSIPVECSFCFGNEGLAFCTGQNVKLSSECNVLRYVPCCVEFSGVYWRFVLHTIPVSSGAVTKKSVPFEIKDWDTLCFASKKFIYKIDNGLWFTPQEDIKISRNTEHTIYWQSVDYKKGNPIFSFLLPSRPKVAKNQNADGSVTFSFAGGVLDNLQNNFCFFDSNTKKSAQVAPGAFASITIDTFTGDRLKSSMQVGVWCEGVFQGNQTLEYDINKSRPFAPIMTTKVKSENGFFRDDVTLDIAPATKTDSVFYVTKKDFPKDEIPPQTDFVPLTAGVKSILLKADLQKSVTYTVFSYAKAQNGSTSALECFSATIDGIDFYLDEKAATTAGDTVATKKDIFRGSKDNPFSTIEEAFSVINTRKFSRLYVTGDITVKTQQLQIKADCKIIAQGAAKIYLPSRSNIFVSGVDFEILGCTIETLPEDATNVYKEVALTTAPPVFSVSGSTFSLSGCDVLDNADTSSCIIEAVSSVLTLNDTGLTARSTQYSCAVSCNSCKLMVKASRIISIADTAICFSVTKNTFDIRNSSCNVVGKIGRIMELVDVRTSLVNNVFEAQLNSAVELAAIWKDPATVILKNDSNRQSGF